MYNIDVKYEWDENKNNVNFHKHGLNFSDSVHVFEAPLIITEDTRQDYGEERMIGIGILENRFVVIVYTENDEKDVRRIISLRKATKNEREFYEKST